MPAAECAAVESQVITSAITIRLPIAVKPIQRGGKTFCLVVTGSSRSDLWLPYGNIGWLLWLPSSLREPCPYSLVRCGATASCHRMPASLAGNKRCKPAFRGRDTKTRLRGRVSEARGTALRGPHAVVRPITQHSLHARRFSLGRSLGDTESAFRFEKSTQKSPPVT